MSDTLLPQWETISREERYFTSFLFHELRRDPAPLWEILKKKLAVNPSATVTDVGFEVCFFRDMARAGLLERHLDLEKQTFDLVLTLSTGAFVIIEAKAQQAFGTGQLKAIKTVAHDRIKQSAKLHARHHDIFLVGLCSSRAALRNSLPYFDAVIRWIELESAYSSIKEQLRRADDLYGK